MKLSIKSRFVGIRFAKAAIVVIALTSSGGLVSAQEIGLPILTPDALTVGRQTKVVVSAAVQVPNIVPGSVNVQRVDALGRASVLGLLTDDGVGGDLVASDGIYSGTFALAEATSGSIQIKVSAAARGSVRRINSPLFSLVILPIGAPVTSVTPNLANTSIDPRTGAKIVADMVIACFRPVTVYERIAFLSATVNASVVGRLSSDIGNCYQLQLPQGSTGVTVANAITSLSANPEVTSAGPDTFRGLAESCSLPTCTVSSRSYAKQLQLPVAHDIFSRGKGVRIGVVDTGMYLDPITVLNLGTSLTVGPDFTFPAPYFPGTAEDDQGHGTNVLTILKATSPESEFYINKWFSGIRSGTVSTSIAAYKDMKAKAVQVLNISTAGFGADVHEALAINALLQSKIIVVAAAGNASAVSPPAQPEYPGAYPGVFTVGSVSDGDIVSSFSDRGSHVEIAAPGENVTGYGFGGSFVAMNGTSQATPFVSGLIALVKAKYPGIDAVKQVIKTALPIPEVIGQDQCGLGPSAACNQNLGAGRIAPLAALGAMRITRNTAIGAGAIQQTEVTISPTPVAAYRGVIQTSGQSQGCHNANSKSIPCIVDLPFDFATLPPGFHTITLRTLETGSVSFFGTLELFAPGVSFVSVQSGNGSIVNPQRATLSLFSFSTRSATFVINKL